MMKSCSVFHVEQNMEFEKFNYFLIDKVKSYFDRGRKRVYTRHNLADLLCISIDWFLYDKRIYWTVFPNRL